MPLFSNYTMCNMMTGVGLSHDIGGGLSMAWLAVVIIFFVLAFSKKWIFEEMLQSPFSLIVGGAAGVLSHIVAVMFTCQYKIGLVVGLLAGFVVGYLGGNLMGEDVI